MQVVILCGGLGTRLSEETDTIPKPMVLINEKPIIEHIMMCYARYGFKEFILAGGYKSLVIKKYFLDYNIDKSNIDIDLKKLLNFHKKNKKIATMTVVRPQARFGSLVIKNNKVIKFKEKDKLSEGWINGGFFVLNKKVFDYLSNKSDCIFEKEPLEKLSKNRQLMAFKHEGFWHPMDTLRDKRDLNNFAKQKKIPWLI